MMIFLVFAAALGGAWRILLGPARPAVALAAGAAAGFGLWLSVEFMLTLAVVFAALSLVWIREGGESARKNRWHGFGLLGTIVVALAIERPPEAWFLEEADRLSVIHLLIAAAASAFWVLVAWLERRHLIERARSRLVVALCGASVAFGLLYLLYPVVVVGGPAFLVNLAPPLGSDVLQGACGVVHGAVPGGFVGKGDHGDLLH